MLVLMEVQIKNKSRQFPFENLIFCREPHSASQSVALHRLKISGIKYAVINLQTLQRRPSLMQKCRSSIGII